MPPATIAAYKDHGQPEVRVDARPDQAATQVIEQLEELGIHMDEVTQQLEEEGVASFGKSFDSLIAVVEARREAVVRTPHGGCTCPAGATWRNGDALAALAEAKFAERLWQKDPRLWKPDDPQHQAEIKIRMGWLDVHD